MNTDAATGSKASMWGMVLFGIHLEMPSLTHEDALPGQCLALGAQYFAPRAQCLAPKAPWPVLCTRGFIPGQYIIPRFSLLGNISSQDFRPWGPRRAAPHKYAPRPCILQNTTFRHSQIFAFIEEECEAIFYKRLHLISFPLPYLYKSISVCLLHLNQKVVRTIHATWSQTKKKKQKKNLKKLKRKQQKGADVKNIKCSWTSLSTSLYLTEEKWHEVNMEECNVRILSYCHNG